jgi:hypothetical protein
VQKVHGVEALLMARTNGIEEAQRWLSMAGNTVVRVREQSRAAQKEEGREHETLHCPRVAG